MSEVVVISFNFKTVVCFDFAVPVGVLRRRFPVKQAFNSVVVL